MLVVLGIIGVLASILVPTIGRARRAARLVICQNNMRVFGQGMLAYAAAFDRALPWDGYAEGDRPIRHAGRWEEPSVWFNAAPQYAGQTPYYKLQNAEMAGGPALPKPGDNSMFVCPEAELVKGDGEDFLSIEGYQLLWGLDNNNAPVQRKTFWCYGYNTRLDGGVEDRNVSYRVTISLGKLKHPGEMVLMAEKIMRPGEFDPPYTGSIGQQQISISEFAGRHDKGGFILFCDGHVTHFRLSEVSGSAGVDRPGLIVWDPRFGSR